MCLEDFLDTKVWLSATVFAGLCEAILTASLQRDWLLPPPLLQAEAHEVLARKFPHLPQAQALFDAIWPQAICVHDLDEPADENDVGLVKAASLAGADVFVTGDKRVLTWGREGNMQILSPRNAWMQLFAGINGA
jgi:predicted nucleic acid-binding protein